MSMLDWKAHVDPARVPRLSKSMCRMTLTDYPPPFETLVGMWGRLAAVPFRGIITNGHALEGVYSLRPNGAPIEAAANAAMRWLESLDPNQRQKVTFPLQSDYWRQWHNTPLVLRDPQVELEALSSTQRTGALNIVKASLSDAGFRQVIEVMGNNQLLGELNNLTDIMNQWSFTLSIYGKPSTNDPWGWQLFGHHLALNCVFVGGSMTLTPVFLGMEPDEVGGASARRFFEPHEQSALAFMHTLDAKERKHAVLYESMLKADQPGGRFHPDDGRMLGGAFQDNRIVPDEGLPLFGISKQQRSLLLRLVEHFTDNLPSGPAEARRIEIERELDRSWFAWIGKVDDINPFYFRLKSPVALIEFDHHSGIFLANAEPARFHVHTLVRSPNGGDYGVDLLRQHYAAGGHARAGSGTSTLHSHDGGRSFHQHK
jgi:hypothetical protein